MMINAPPAGAHRFGVIALCGPPNAGKSTLLNQLVGEKISIVSRRPQTTRHRILGIKTLPRAQLVFVDTPGLHRDQTKNLNRVMHRTALQSLNEVDLIMFMIDDRGWTPRLTPLFQSVANHGAPIILLINKIDRLPDRRQLLPRIARAKEMHTFREIIPLSARRSGDAENLLATLTSILPAGEPGFPADQRTDRSRRFFAAELVREQLFRRLGRELPYASAVEVTKFQYQDEQLLQVAAIIWTERAGQKAIIIGRGGRQLKRIGQYARMQMQKSFAARVHLELWVKMRRGWADNAAQLRALGYMEDQ